MLLTLRLWDDVASIPSDRLRVPGRVTCRPENQRRWPVLLLALSLASLLSLGIYFDTWQAKSLGLALISFFALWYAKGSKVFVASSSSRPMLSLLKYPLLLLLVYFDRSGARALLAEAVAGLIALYLAFCVYELLHEDAGVSRKVRPSLALRLTALAWAGLPFLFRPVDSGYLALLCLLLFVLSCGLFLMDKNLEKISELPRWSWRAFLPHLLSMTHSVLARY